MPENGSSLLKHVEELMCMNALRFYINCVCVLVHVGDPVGSHIISCAKDQIATCDYCLDCLYDDYESQFQIMHQVF
jgi:hypothetical protein